MKEQLLRKLLNRFKKDDYVYVVQNWAPLEGEGPPDLQTRPYAKKDFINYVLSNIQDVTSEDLAQLDILYLQKYSRSRLWKVYSLERLPDAERSSVCKLEEYRRQLQHQLNIYFDTELCVRVQGETFWVRLCVENGGRHGNTSPTYIVHHPLTDYLVVHNLKAAHQEYVMQAYLNMLSCHKVEPLHLQGRCIQSLVQLVLNKHSQGDPSKYGVEETGRKKRKRDELDEDFDCRVVCENAGDRKRRQCTLQANFGEHLQPTLERIEYKMETTFKGTKFAPGMSARDGVFNCRVKFEGKHVLEGIRNLGSAGIAELPMKSHLGKIQNMARNTFLLRQKTGNSILPSSQQTPQS